MRDRIAGILGGMWIILLLPGCSTPEITVVDGAGIPVQDAIITGTSLSIGGQRTTTDQGGSASIPWAAQETKWISVEKDGYITVDRIDVNRTKPIRIILKKK